MSGESHLFDISLIPAIAGGYLGPRVSTLRALRGEPVTESELLADDSEWGVWRLGGPLTYRPPELWADAVHDHCYGGEE